MHAQGTNLPDKHRVVTRTFNDTEYPSLRRNDLSNPR